MDKINSCFENLMKDLPITVSFDSNFNDTLTIKVTPKELVESGTSEFIIVDYNDINSFIKESIVKGMVLIDNTYNTEYNIKSYDTDLGVIRLDKPIDRNLETSIDILSISYSSILKITNNPPSYLNRDTNSVDYKVYGVRYFFTLTCKNDLNNILERNVIKLLNVFNKESFLCDNKLIYVIDPLDFKTVIDRDKSTKVALGTIRMKIELGDDI